MRSNSRKSLPATQAWVLAGLVVVAGCEAEIPGIGCEADSDCPAGRCVDGLCVDVEGCNPACAGHADCVEGECIPAFVAVAIAAPVAGERIRGPFEVVARLEKRTGTTAAAHPLPEALELWVARGEANPARSDLPFDAASETYRTTVNPEAGGTYRLEVKLAGVEEPKATAEVRVDLCAEACSPDSECIGDRCEVALTALTIVSPVQGSWADAPLTVEARVTRRAGSEHPYPVSLAGSATGPGGVESVGPLVADGAEPGVYRGAIEGEEGGGQ